MTIDISKTYRTRDGREVRIDPERSIDYLYARSQWEPMSGCLLWSGHIGSGGYGQASSFKNNISAHKLSWFAHYGPVPEKMDVCHKCDVRACINPSHLFLGTCKENLDDMVRKGRAVRRGPKGERHPKVKVTECDVRAMRKEHGAGGISYADMGRKYGVAWNTARAAIIGETWGHIQ